MRFYRAGPPSLGVGIVGGVVGYGTSGRDVEEAPESMNNQVLEFNFKYLDRWQSLFSFSKLICLQ